MATHKIGKEEPKKEKNIKHGIIALGALALLVLLIIIAAHLL